MTAKEVQAYLDEKDSMGLLYSYAKGWVDSDRRLFVLIVQERTYDEIIKPVLGRYSTRIRLHNKGLITVHVVVPVEKSEL